MATILLVEDTDEVQETFRLFARQQGHELFVAADGDEGLRLYDAIRPDLVLTDILLPEKDGIEMCRELLKVHPGAVIFGYSGAALSDDYFKLIRSYGVKRCFSKPLSFARLAEAIDEELSAQPTGTS